MNIVLIGYMGSGKSTIGKILADRLNMSFVDSDEEIEKEEGMSISEIFRIHGEDHFRQLEVEFLLHTEFDNCVLSTGGGMPCFYGNINRLNLIGETIYLQVSSDELEERLKSADEQNKRPLSQAFFGEMLMARTPDYSQAKHIIDATTNVTSIIENILSNLNR